MPKRIHEVALSLGLKEEEIIPYGTDKAKISLEALKRLEANPDGKLVVVTAITPTPAGEGKTVITIGLGDALRRLGRSPVVCIREPSLGPTFGMKGGGAGGGKAMAFPAEDLNLHFTGDFHAITAAHNLLTALAEAHLYHGNEAGFAPHGLWWNRVLDVTDRSLRHVIVGLGGRANGIPRETGFDITAASEIMALMGLCNGLSDMRERLKRIVIGVSKENKPITAEQIGAAGAMAVLLRDALQPNLIQTLEGTPLFAHIGPFGNLATGHNSVLSDRLALKLGEIVVTEVGFGSDLGFEKFCHVVVPQLGKAPDAAVLVATVRGLKAHSDKFNLTPGKPFPPELEREDLEALKAGVENLNAHIRNIQQFGVPVVVAINRFPTDTEAELNLLREAALAFGAEGVAVANSFVCGGEGGAELAEAVLQVLSHQTARFHPLYEANQPLREKIEIVASRVYGAAQVRYERDAEKQLRQIEGWGYNLPVCFAKTQYSFSHDPALKGAPTGFTLPVVEVRLAGGAGLVQVLCGDILTMPGFGKQPSALKMDLDEAGNIVGMTH